MISFTMWLVSADVFSLKLESTCIFYILKFISIHLVFFISYFKFIPNNVWNYLFSSCVSYISYFPRCAWRWQMCFPQGWGSKGRLSGGSSNHTTHSYHLVWHHIHTISTFIRSHHIHNTNQITHAADTLLSNHTHTDWMYLDQHVALLYFY